MRHLSYVLATNHCNVCACVCVYLDLDLDVKSPVTVSVYIHDAALCANACAQRFSVRVHLAGGGCFWQSSHSYPLCPYMMSRMKTLSLFDDTGPAVSFYDVRK